MSRELVEVLETLMVVVKRIDKNVKTLMAAKPASEADLDGKYGNPEIRFNPHGWRGASYVGRVMSDCPAAYLELYAEAKDFMAERDEEEWKVTSSGKPTADFQRKDAARARGWAARRRTRGTSPAPEAQPEPETAEPDWASPNAPDIAPNEDDIPF